MAPHSITIVTEDVDIANALASQYCKVFSIPSVKLNSKKIDEIFEYEGNINEISVTDAKIKKAISELR